jgi:hypothetical protein
MLVFQYVRNSVSCDDVPLAIVHGSVVVHQRS